MHGLDADLGGVISAALLLRNKRADGFSGRFNAIVNIYIHTVIYFTGKYLRGLRECKTCSCALVECENPKVTHAFSALEFDMILRSLPAI
jgi:hypothetical protein